MGDHQDSQRESGAVEGHSANNQETLSGAGVVKPASEMFAQVYEEIHRIAHSFMVKEGDGHVLQTTALVNDAYMRMIKQYRNSSATTGPNDERHLLNAIALAMRHVLIDDARKRKAGKRGGDNHRVTLDSGIAIAESPPDHEELHKALLLLESLDFHAVEVVNLRFYCGKTMQEIADLLGKPKCRVERDWAFSRAWLRNNWRLKMSVKRELTAVVTSQR